MTSPAGIQFMLIMVVVVTLTSGVGFAVDVIDDFRRARRRGRLACITIARLLVVACMSALCLWSCAYTLKALVVADVPLLGGSR